MRRVAFRTSPVLARTLVASVRSDRLVRCITVLVVGLISALVLPSGAFATTPKTIKGTVTAIGPYSVTIQTSGARTGVINALTEAANAMTARNYPYVWGGGHAEAGVASIGIKGPGYNGRRIGYDCSGSVAAVLAGAGLWPAESSVPGDAGVIAQLLQEKLIARGVGQAPDDVTLYDYPGVHIFMSIDGRFFGTSDGGAGNSKGGPTWLDDGAPDASSRIYKRYHVLPSVLKDQTTYAQSFTFQIGQNAGATGGFALGDDVQVSYVENSTGSLTARTIGFVGTMSANGTVWSVAPNKTSFVLETVQGQNVTLLTDSATARITGLQAGDQVQVVYTKTAQGTLTARSVAIPAISGVSQATGSIVAIAPNLSSFTVETDDGQELTFASGGLPNVIYLQVGDTVQVSYVQAAGGTLTAQQIAPAQPEIATGGGAPGPSNAG